MLCDRSGGRSEASKGFLASESWGFPACSLALGYLVYHSSYIWHFQKTDIYAHPSTLGWRWNHALQRMVHRCCVLYALVKCQLFCLSSLKPPPVFWWRKYPVLEIWFCSHRVGHTESWRHACVFGMLQVCGCWAHLNTDGCFRDFNEGFLMNIFSNTSQRLVT